MPTSNQVSFSLNELTADQLTALHDQRLAAVKKSGPLREPDFATVIAAVTKYSNAAGKAAQIETPYEIPASFHARLSASEAAALYYLNKTRQFKLPPEYSQMMAVANDYFSLRADSKIDWPKIKQVDREVAGNCVTQWEPIRVIDMVMLRTAITNSPTSPGWGNPANIAWNWFSFIESPIRLIPIDTKCQYCEDNAPAHFSLLKDEGVKTLVETVGLSNPDIDQNTKGENITKYFIGVVHAVNTAKSLLPEMKRLGKVMTVNIVPQKGYARHLMAIRSNNYIR